MTLHTALYTRVSTDDQNLTLEPGDDDPYQRAFLNIMETIAQLEADMIRERTRSGVEVAKQAGKRTGRLV